MTEQARAGLFEAEEDTVSPVVDFDISGFAAKPPERRTRLPLPEDVKAVAAARGFKSREPLPVEEREAPARRESRRKREPRRYRTGRNVQLNIKARQDTIDEFNALCDAQCWVQGETLHRAIAALKRELAAQATDQSL